MKGDKTLYKANDYYVEITSECNLRCIHCYNDSGAKQVLLMPSVIENILFKRMYRDGNPKW